VGQRQAEFAERLVAGRGALHQRVHHRHLARIGDLREHGASADAFDGGSRRQHTQAAAAAERGGDNPSHATEQRTDSEVEGRARGHGLRRGRRRLDHGHAESHSARVDRRDAPGEELTEGVGDLRGGLGVTVGDADTNHRRVCRDSDLDVADQFDPVHRQPEAVDYVVDDGGGCRHAGE